MPQRETTLEAWTLPNLAAPFAQKFALTPYVNSRTFSIDYSAGGDGSMELSRDFPYFDSFVHVDSLDHTNDVGSLVRVCKDGTPVAHYLARRFEDDIDPTAVLRPVTLQSLNFFLDRAHVAPYDHIPGDDANSPNPTLDPDWEYGAESALPVLGNEISNELHEVWRGSDVTMGTFRLSDGVDDTDDIDWDASNSEIRTRLETDIASIVDVSVRGDGSLKTPWEIEYVNPAGNVPFLISVSTNATDGNFSTSITRNGGTLDPSPWHKSYNPVTKTEHGNYQGFEIMHRDDVPAGLQAASADEYFLRVNLDSVNNSTDYGGAQILPNVEPGSRYRSSVPVWAAFEFGARHVLRQMNEVHIADGGDVTVAASTLTELTIPTFTTGTSTTEIIYRVGILETTDIGDIYIAIMSAVLAPGEPAANYGKIMNDQLVPINARGMLTWVTPTWTDDLDSAGVAWDQPLQWTVSHRQSLLQLVEFARQWGYESSGIYWSVANARFQWDLFNPGGGGSVLTEPVITVGDIDGTSPVTHVSPALSSAWAFGRNGIWGRYEDPDLIAAFGILESMDLDRQGRENLVTHAMEAVEAAKMSATGQRLRLRTDRFTAFVDVNPGDFIEVNLGPRFINGVYRVAGITDVVDEEGDEYQEFHVGTLVKDASTAVTDTVRELYRKFELIDQGDGSSGAINPAQTTIPDPVQGQPILIAAANSPQAWKDAAYAVGTGTAIAGGDEVTINTARADHDALGIGAHIRLAPGTYYVSPETSSIVLTNYSTLAGFGHDTIIQMVNPTDNAIDEFAITMGSHCAVRDLTINGAWPANSTEYGIDIGDYSVIENVLGETGNGWLITGIGDNPLVRGVRSEWEGGLVNYTNAFGARIIGCYANSFGIDGTGIVTVVQGSDLVISECDLWTYGSGSDVIQLGGTGQIDKVRIVGNRLLQYGSGAATTSVVRVLGAIDFFDSIFADNSITSFDGLGISIDGAGSALLAYDNIISDNVISAPVWGVKIAADVDVLSIVGNSFSGGSDGGLIWFDCDIASTDARTVRIVGNSFDDFSADGLVFEGTIGDVLIAANIFADGGSSTNDYVRIAGDHDHFFITANRLSPRVGGSVPRYGINPTDATNAPQVVAVGNDLRGTWTTAPINVTNSPIVDYPADATFGDNFT